MPHSGAPGPRFSPVGNDNLYIDSDPLYRETGSGLGLGGGVSIYI